MERELKQPFTNAQLELLKLFSIDLNEQELKDLKHTIGLIHLNRLTAVADKTWDEKGWTAETMEEFLKTKMRKKSS